MDPLTQAALGAAIGEAGFRRKLGPKATAFGALCGLLPDADMVLSLFDEWATFAYHRSVTHSLLTLTIAAPLLAWIGCRLWGQRSQYASWLHLSLWALLTHSLLDACTSYGTLLFWPISDRRFAFDAIAVIDPAYTLILLVALAAARLWRAQAQHIAVAALVLSSAYMGLGAWQSRRASAIAERQFTGQPGAVAQIRTTPTPLNIWLWRVLIRTQDGDLFVGYVSTLNTHTIKFVHVKAPGHSLWKRALQTDRGRMFEWFAMGWVSGEVDPQVEGTAVELSDQRYGLLTRPTQSPFRMRVLFDRTGAPVSVTRASGLPPTSIERELASLWAGILGAPPGL